MIALINNARANHGLGVLSVGSAVTSVARSWSAHLAARNAGLAHNPNMLSQILALVPLSLVLENVGTATGVFARVDFMFDAFMDSDGHRANILSSSVSQVAVGCVRSGDALWVTHNFWG